MKTSLLYLLLSFFSLSLLAQNRVAYYPFSGNVGDSSGYGNHGTKHGSPTLTTDRNGVSNKAYYFNGTSDYITADTSASIQPDSQITLTAWVAPDYRTDGGFMSIVCKRHSVATDPYDSYAMMTNNATPYSNKWRFNISKGTTGTLTAVEAKRSYAPQTWLFLAATYDGANMRMYVNGVLDTIIPFTGTIGYTSMPLYIAYNSAGIHEYYKGKIDEVSIYKKALSDTDIVNQYKETNVISLAKDTMICQYGDPLTYSLSFNCITAWQIIDSCSWLSLNAISGEQNASLSLYLQKNNTGAPRSADITIKAGAQYKVLHIIQGIAPAPDLVAYYPFSGNVGDSSTYGNHGTINGAPTLTNDRNGVSNSAYYFNGTSDYITANPTTSLQPDSQITLTAWVAPDYRADGGFMNIVCKRHTVAADPYDSYALMTNDASPYNNKWRFNISQGTTGTLVGADANRSYAPQTWLFLTATYDGSNMRMYVNGELDTTIAYTGAIGYTNMPLYIGYNSAGTYEYYKGVIDEVSIYKRAISDSEVVAQYNQTNVLSLSTDTLSFTADAGNDSTILNCITAWEVINSSPWVSFNTNAGEKNATMVITVQENTDTVTRATDVMVKAGAQYKLLHIIQDTGQIPMDTTPKPDLVAYYQFSGNAGDSSTYGNHGTINGTPTLTTDRNGVADNAYYFNGSSDYITANATTSLQPDSQITLTAWVAPDYRTDGSFMNIVCKRHSVATDPYDSYALMTNDASPYNNKWRFNISQGTTGTLVGADANRSYAPQTWLFLTATYDGSNMRMYVNGELDTTIAYTGAIGYTNMPLYIAYNSAGIHEYYKGVIDEVSIYKRAISDSEVVAYYNQTNVLSLSADTLSFTADAGNDSTILTCITAWEVLNTESWISFTNNSGEKDATLTLNVEQNTSTSPRSADVIIKAGAQSKLLHIIQDATTGINDLTLNQARISLYPNPANNRAYLSSDKTIESVSLYDMAGNQLDLEIINKTQNKLELNIQNLGTGVYFLSVVSNGNTSHHKLLIKK